MQIPTFTFWNTLSSIVTVLGFAVVIYAAFVALGQLREMARARYLEAMLRIYEMIGSDEMRKHRRFIYEKLGERPERLSKEERETVEHVCVTLDRIGKLVEAGLIPRDMLLKSQGEIFIKTWSKLEPHVRYIRHIAGERWVYGFEMLARAAQAYYDRHFPDYVITVQPAESSAEIPNAEVGG